MKKILIIAYYFPPNPEIGGVRATKFARYLPDYNWKPYVLTVDTSDVSNADISRLKEIEGIPITRTNTWPTVLDILVTLKKKLGFNQTKESHHTSTFKVAQKEHKTVRDALGKKSNRLTVKEYCEYFELDFQEIVSFLNPYR